MIWTLIGTNTLVFLLWQSAKVAAGRDNDFRPLKAMALVSTLSLDNAEARPYTLLTSCLSHASLGHFLFNMVTLKTFADVLQLFPGIGAGHLLAVCFGSGIAGSVAWIAQQNSTAKAYYADERRALGASGMVMGAGAAATMLLPRAPMNLFFIPVPIPLWIITALYFAVDILSLQTDSGIGHAAHLGGGAFGIAYYALFLRRFKFGWGM